MIEPIEYLCIWECDAFHKTARQAADEFAATFWDTPRKALAIDPHGFFRVKDGQRLYQVRLVDNVPTVYRITVAEEREHYGLQIV